MIPTLPTAACSRSSRPEGRSALALGLTAPPDRVLYDRMKPRARRRIIIALIVIGSIAIWTFWRLPIPPRPPPCTLVPFDESDPQQIGTCTGKCPDSRPPICYPFPKTRLQPGVRVDGFCQCHDTLSDALDRKMALLRTDAGLTPLGERDKACQDLLQEARRRDAGDPDEYTRCSIEVEREINALLANNPKDGGPPP